MGKRGHNASAEEISWARIKALRKNGKEILQNLERLRGVQPKVIEKKKKELEKLVFILERLRPDYENRKTTKNMLDDLNIKIHQIRISCDDKSKEFL